MTLDRIQILTSSHRTPCMHGPYFSSGQEINEEQNNPKINPALRLIRPQRRSPHYGRNQIIIFGTTDGSGVHTAGMCAAAPLRLSKRKIK